MLDGRQSTLRDKGSKLIVDGVVRRLAAGCVEG
jgi:hypothetical protein